MFEEANYHRLVKLEQDAQPLKSEFAHLLKAKDFISQAKPQRLSTIELERIDDYTIDASFANTTVRFHLLLTYAKGRSCGRVECLRKCSLFGEVQYNKLGDFSFTTHGDTDLKMNHQGETLCMSFNPDTIVLTFLDRAIETGPAKLHQAG